MSYLWGSLMALIAIFFIWSGSNKSKFVIYRVLTSKGERLWGDKIHSFFIAVGIILLGLSSLFFIGVW